MKRKYLESEECIKFNNWIEENNLGDYLIRNAVPTSPTMMTVLKKEGFKKGVPDYFLSYPTQKYHGLFIEMKTITGTVTKEQIKFMHHKLAHNYICCVCYSAECAIEACCRYGNDNIPELAENHIWYIRD